MKLIFDIDLKIRGDAISRRQVKGKFDISLLTADLAFVTLGVLSFYLARIFSKKIIL